MLNPKLLIIAGLVGLGLLAVLVFYFPPFVEYDGNAAPSVGSERAANGEFAPPPNAFTAPAAGTGPVASAPSAVKEPSAAPAPVQQTGKSPETPKFGADIPSIEDAASAVRGVIEKASSLSAASETLDLPPVSDASLNITPEGPSDPVRYIESFSVSSFGGKGGGLEFDGRKFADALKDENGLPLFPQQLVERGIAGGNFAELKQSLLVFRDFVSAKKRFTESLPVSGAAVAVAKENIAFDILTQSLIDKALAAADGKAAVSDVKDFYGKFKATADFRHEELLRKTGVISYEESGLFRRIAKFLAGGNVAFAALPLPFGTFIVTPILCTCSASYLIYTGPPTPPVAGALNASVAWLASPALFPLKSLKPGAAWLGVYSAATAPCLMYVGLGCSPIGVGNVPVIAGTSL